MMKLISVIVPIYNVAPYLEKCVNTIRNQTYKNLEILLIDDGSTDESGLLCDRLAREDHRITVYHKENGGLSSARNYGIARANGSYVGFVDGDDYLLPTMYEILIQGIQTYGVSIAQVGRKEIAESGEELPPVCFTPDTATVISTREMMRSLLVFEGDSSFCTKLFHASVLKGVQFEQGILNEDFRLLIELLVREEFMVQLPEFGYCVYYRTGSITRTKTRAEFSKAYEDAIINADWVLEFVKKHQIPFEEIAIMFGFSQRNEYLLHIPISRMVKGNTTYEKIVSSVRKHLLQIIRTKYLTKKKKIYLVLFATNARFIRQVHAKVRGLS